MNNLAFDAEIVLTHRVLNRALSLATEYHRFDTPTSSVDTSVS